MEYRLAAAETIKGRGNELFKQVRTSFACASRLVAERYDGGARVHDPTRWLDALFLMFSLGIDVTCIWRGSLL